MINADITMAPKRIEKLNAIYNTVISIIENGENYGEISVEELAKRSGIGKGTIYEYFSSKEDIYNSTLSKIIDEFAISMKATVKESFDESFNAFFDFFMEFSKKCESLLNAVVRDCNAKGEFKPQILEKEMTELQELFVNVFDSILRQGIDEKILTKRDKDIEKFFYTGAIMSILSNGFYRDKIDFTEYKDKAKSILVKLLN